MKGSGIVHSSQCVDCAQLGLPPSRGSVRLEHPRLLTCVSGVLTGMAARRDSAGPPPVSGPPPLQVASPPGFSFRAPGLLTIARGSQKDMSRVASLGRWDRQKSKAAPEIPTHWRTCPV